MWRRSHDLAPFLALLKLQMSFLQVTTNGKIDKIITFYENYNRKYKENI